MNCSHDLYKNRIQELRNTVFENIEKNSDPVWKNGSFDNIKKIAIICSASRSGSTLLFELLRRHSDIYSLPGECVPYYKLNHLSMNTLLSEHMNIHDLDVLSLTRDILNDISFYTENIENTCLDLDYIHSLILRFSIQWPNISFKYDTFKKLAFAAINQFKLKNKIFEKNSFYIELLKQLRTEYKDIDPYYYDIDPMLIQKNFPDIICPSGPPNENILIEEPLFILISPEKKVKASDLENKTFLIKSPVNTYRFRLLKDLFKNADIKYIYLTRNPASSINGLYDGWLHRGFFSHDLRPCFESGLNIKKLNIIDYSDKFKWAEYWWNYELIPNWIDCCNKKLEFVCADQWYFSNRTICEYLKDHCFHSAMHENIVKDKYSMSVQISKILDSINVNPDENIIPEKIPVVQQTKFPRLSRWKLREKIIVPVLKSDNMKKLIDDLGYSENIGDWS